MSAFSANTTSLTRLQRTALEREAAAQPAATAFASYSPVARSSDFDSLEQEYLSRLRARSPAARRAETASAQRASASRSRPNRASKADIGRSYAAIWVLRIASFVAIAGFTCALSSLAGGVLTEKSRIEGFRASKRAEAAEQVQAQLSHDVSARTSLSAIRSWAEEQKFRSSATPVSSDPATPEASPSGYVRPSVRRHHAVHSSSGGVG